MLSSEKEKLLEIYDILTSGRVFLARQMLAELLGITDDEPPEAA